MEREVVVAGRVEIRDRHGRVRAVLGDLPGGGFGLSLLDLSGSERASFGLFPHGPGVSLAAAGDTLAEFAVHDDPDADPEARLVILNLAGEAVVELPAPPEGANHDTHDEGRGR